MMPFDVNGLPQSFATMIRTSPKGMFLKIFQDSVNFDSVKLSVKIFTSSWEGKLSHLF